MGPSPAMTRKVVCLAPADSAISRQALNCVVEGLVGYVAKRLIHRERRLILLGDAHDLCWNPGHRRMSRHRVQHDRAGSDSRMRTNLYVAKDLGPRADHHTL